MHAKLNHINSSTGSAHCSKKLRLGIVGAVFGSSFQFELHPNCEVVAVSDLREEGRKSLQKKYKCNTAYNDLKGLLKDKDIDAVFIATPAPQHAQDTIDSLLSGKHVLCAVPVALSIADCYRVLEIVKSTGLIYMMAETSYYRQSTISARHFYEQGLFGNIFNTTAEYSHPGLEDYFFDSNREPTWRHGLPPMYYPTHCIAFLVSVTGERLKTVSCMGWGDDSALLKSNQYNNPFWNERALFGTDKGNSMIVEINWKGALKNVEKANWKGEKMSFISSSNNDGLHTIIKQNNERAIDDGGFDHVLNEEELYRQPQWWLTDLLPEELRVPSGHDGSHTFITHEFVHAVLNNRKPAINIYEALACTVPGLIAHESALKNGESMSIPSF